MEAKASGSDKEERGEDVLGEEKAHDDVEEGNTNNVGDVGKEVLAGEAGNGGLLADSKKQVLAKRVESGHKGDGSRLDNNGVLEENTTFAELIGAVGLGDKGFKGDGEANGEAKASDVAEGDGKGACGKLGGLAAIADHGLWEEASGEHSEVEPNHRQA